MKDELKKQALTTHFSFPTSGLLDLVVHTGITIVIAVVIVVISNVKTR